MPKTVLASKIFELRKSKKLTQRELGKRVGVSGGAISQFESGETAPSVSTREKLSEVFELDLSEVWDQSPKPDEVRDDYVNLKFTPIAGYPTFIHLLEGESLFDTYHTTHNTVPVLRLPGIEYNDLCGVIEINGNSMAPRYPHGSRYCYTFEIEKLKYSNGVYLFVLNNKLFVRRIISNKAGIMTLRADANGEEMTLIVAEMEAMLDNCTAMMIKLGQAVHMPPEE